MDCLNPRCTSSCQECDGGGTIPDAQGVARNAVTVFAIANGADPDQLVLHSLDEAGGQYRCPVGERVAACGWTL
jgi:hypothetical protein